MVQLSKQKLKPPILDKLFILLFDVLGKKRNQIEFNNLINGLFSPVEKVMIAKRVAILFLLVQEEEWNTIREILHVSLSTVSKCQMMLLGNVEMNKVFNCLLRRKEADIFFDELFLTFFGPGTAHTNWKESWKIKNKLKQKKAQIL